MGLFTPKISTAQMQFVRTTLNQMYDSGKLANETVNPAVFFKRLNFTLDLLLRLQPYEKYKIFKHGTPTQDYRKIVGNMEATVDDFVTRVLKDNQAKMFCKKTVRARNKCFVDCANALISAFDCAHTFWKGDRGFPHYSGSLYTDRNYARVQAIWDEACSEKYDCE